NSTVVASAVSFRDPQSVRRALNTVSHEFFHCWNVERIRPKSLEPFDFEEANISGELWLAEGFTQYYGPLVMARAGLTPGESGVGLVGNALTIINGPGRQFHSAVEMSQMAPFTDAAVAIDETNFSNTFISYYSYGAAIATALDLSLRDRSDGKITLDDYMRAMWIAHGKPDGPSPGIIARPYTLKDARDRLAEVSGDRRFADEFFDRYVEGREAPDYARLFDRVGLSLRKANAGAPWVGVFDAPRGFGGRGRRGGSSAPRPSAGSEVRIPSLVAWGTPAFKAGLEEDDVITGADRKPVDSVEDWQGAVRAHQPGDQMTVEFMRLGKTHQATMTVGEDPALDVVTIESTGGTLTAAQKAMRQGWLGSRQK
ncbi:MAG: PDZ domain-containing protein, partial [Acidobacteriota bacterium]